MKHCKRFLYSPNKFKKYFIDQYTEQARKQKLRSRAWFKLKEIDNCDKLLKYGMIVVDLGASPGGWSSYVIRKIGDSGIVIACDKSPMEDIPGVKFIQGDCADPIILKKLHSWIQYQKAQIVLSDMSPNTTGISVIDVNKSLYLGHIALNLCHCILMPGGTLLVKIFQGTGVDKYLFCVKSVFNIVKIRKPVSSRMNSREIYIVAKEFKKKS